MIDDITRLRAAAEGLAAGESHPDAPLACFPMRIDWEMASGYTPEAEPFPAPSVTSADPIPDEAVKPGPVADLEVFAQSVGWATHTAYAYGCMPHATHGTPLAPRASWSVKMARGTERAVAVRRGDDWDSFWYWSPVVFFTQASGLGTFKEAIQ